MLEIFTITARAAIQIAISDFGTEHEKTTWERWSAANPQVRSAATDPVDDGNGPMPPELQETILACLRKRFDHLMTQSRSPLITIDDMAEISNRINHLYSIARHFKPNGLSWPNF